MSIRQHLNDTNKAKDTKRFSVPARFSKGQGANPEKGHLTRDMIIWKGHILIKDVNQTFVFIRWITGYTRTTSLAHIELYLSTFKAEKLVKQLVTQVFLSLLGTVELYMQYVLKGDLFHTVSMVYHILPVSPFYPCCAWWQYSTKQLCSVNSQF